MLLCDFLILFIVVFGHFLSGADKSANDEVEIEDAEGSVVISASDWRLLLGELRQLREELSRSRCLCAVCACLRL